MAFPTIPQIESQLLALIHSRGGDRHQMRPSETYAPLAEHFGLTEDERNVPRDHFHADGRDEPEWHNKVQWARNELRKRGYLIAKRHGYWQLSEKGVAEARRLQASNLRLECFPDEVPETIIEGAKRTVAVNFFERSPEARQACIDHFGYRCFVCDFDFEARYGERGRHFIHVHHLVPIKDIGTAYKVDPIEDLRPVCPNCHAMIHRTDPPALIEDLKRMVR